MSRAIALGVVGYWLGEREGERRAFETAPARGGASGWLGAFLILLAILAWGHVKIGSSPHAPLDRPGKPVAAFSARPAPNARP